MIARAVLFYNAITCQFLSLLLPTMHSLGERFGVPALPIFADLADLGWRKLQILQCNFQARCKAWITKEFSDGPGL